MQPTGPYHLGGWSLGGNIAFEMACQLRQQGAEVGLLALLDAGAVAPNQKATEEDFLAMLLGLFPSDAQLPLEDLRQLTPAKQLEYFVGRAQQAQLVALEGDLAGSASMCSMCSRPTCRLSSNIARGPTKVGSRYCERRSKLWISPATRRLVGARTPRAESTSTSFLAIMFT